MFVLSLRVLPKTVLLSAVGLLSGCLDDLNVTRFDSAPSAEPVAIDFRDRHPGDLVGGTIAITPANDGQTDTDKWTFDTYIAQWAVDGVVVPTDMFMQSNVVGRVDRMNNPLVISFYQRPPNGANSIVVSTANALGLAPQGKVVYFENLLVSPLVPSANAVPQYVSFYDNQYNVTILGTLTFERPAAYDKCDDSGCTHITNTQFDITKYVARYADSDGCPLTSVNPILEIPVEADGRYSVSIGSGGIVQYPPSDARAIVVRPANDHGEAYSEDCSSYARSSVSTFNRISAGKYPHFKANAYFTKDEDDTDTYTGNLIIEPSADERDNGVGYYVLWNSRKTSVAANYLTRFDADSTQHQLRLDKWLPPPFGDGSRFPMEDIVFYVVTGDYPAAAGPIDYPAPDKRMTKLDMQTNNAIGSWYLINESPEIGDVPSDYCIKADALNSKIYKAKCDKYDIQQRFYVENASIASNDDMHYIKSAAFENACIFRQDDAGAPNWELRTCNNAWNTQMEIKSYDPSHSTGVYLKKIAVNHDAGWTCLAHYTVTTDLSSPWGNCSPNLQIFWKFLKVGRANDLAVFNDPYVKK